MLSENTSCGVWWLWQTYVCLALLAGVWTSEFQTEPFLCFQEHEKLLYIESDTVGCLVYALACHHDGVAGKALFKNYLRSASLVSCVSFFTQAYCRLLKSTSHPFMLGCFSVFMLAGTTQDKWKDSVSVSRVTPDPPLGNMPLFFPLFLEDPGCEVCWVLTMYLTPAR